MADPERRKPDRKLDCIGLFCPEPIFRARVELDEMGKGEVLELLTDDPAAEEDIPRLARRLGDEILDARREGDKLVFLIKKAST
jgi:TusA-related sulfurtransferase